MLVRRETIIPSLAPDFFLSLICGANSSIDCKIKITIEVGEGRGYGRKRGRDLGLR